MAGITLDEAEELRNDYRHLEGQLFAGKEVTEVFVGPVDKVALEDVLQRRSAGRKYQHLLDAAESYEVYLLLDMDKYTHGSPALALLRSYLLDMND